MLYRHRLDLEHHVRRHSRQLARKLPRLLFAEENALLLDPAANPLLALPNHLLRHSAHFLRCCACLSFSQPPKPRTLQEESAPTDPVVRRTQPERSSLLLPIRCRIASPRSKPNRLPSYFSTSTYSASSSSPPCL